MATLSLKRNLREVSHGRPGERFQAYYERSKHKKKSGAGIDRVVRIGLAVVLFGIGVVFVFIPGPAILFFFIGGGLLASESRWIAKAMDWLELRGRAIWGWGKQHWKALPLGGKVAVAIVVACGSAAGLYGSWMVLWG